MQSRRSKVSPFLVMEVARAAAEREAKGENIIHMEVGQPGTGAPKAALAKVTEVLGQEPLGYSLALGRDDLRAAISDYYQREYALNIDPSRIILTTGSSAAFQLVFIALFDAGARLGIAEPRYPSYRNILHALDLHDAAIRTKIENGFQPLADDISRQKMDGILVASPANPTGTILSKQRLTELITRAASENIPYISDEIYHGLSFGERAVSALEVSDDVYVINSFSKYFSMTGWRLGWIVAPQDKAHIFEPLAQNLFICPPHISQVAGLGAMSIDAKHELEANRKTYARNRDLVMQGLNAISITAFSPPDGAFYVYADVSHLCSDSRVLAQDWLEIGVAVTPGWDFDPKTGGKYMRFSYARETQDIKIAMKRLATWYEARTALRSR